MALSFISIGSNIDPSENIKATKILLDMAFYNCAYSSIYNSQAEGFNGPDFKNLVVKIETDLNPFLLNNILKVIEKKIGRDDSQKKYKNRAIDLDLILYEDLIISEMGIEVPSKDINKFVFVLEPLAEIAGDLTHPILGDTFGDLLKSFKN